MILVISYLFKKLLFLETWNISLILSYFVLDNIIISHRYTIQFSKCIILTNFKL